MTHSIRPNPLFSALLALTLTLVIHPASAQEPEIIRQELKLLSWDRPIKDLELLQADGSEPVIIPNGAPTYPMSYRGTRIVRFGVTVTNADGMQRFELRGSVSLPQTDKPILLIFFPTQDQRYKIVAIPETTSEPAKDAFRVINVTGDRFFIKIGEQQLEIPRGGSKTVYADSSEEKSLSVLMVREEDGSLHRVYSARWARIPDRQITAFLLNDPASNQFTLKRFVE